MVKKIAAVTGGVLIGLVIAFARAGAFPFGDLTPTLPRLTHLRSSKHRQTRLLLCRRHRFPGFMWRRRPSLRSRMHLSPVKKSE